MSEPLNHDLKQQLATMTQERDEQCAGKMAFFEGMNDMREQRTKLERQLTKVTSEKQYHMDCINLLATHIGRLGDTSNTVVDAAIQQLAAVTGERDALRLRIKTVDAEHEHLAVDRRKMFGEYMDEQREKVRREVGEQNLELQRNAILLINKIEALRQQLAAVTQERDWLLKRILNG